MNEVKNSLWKKLVIFEIQNKYFEKATQVSNQIIVIIVLCTCLCIIKVLFLKIKIEIFSYYQLMEKESKIKKTNFLGLSSSS